MAEIPAGIKTVQSEINEALGADLKGVAVYGRALRKLLVLVDAVTPAILDRAAKAVINARKDNLFVLIATKQDILSSADVFPVRYKEIKNTHKHLQGEDFLESLEIHDTHLRLRVEQELKSSMFRARQCYITAHIAAQRATNELADILRNSIAAFDLLKAQCPAAKDLDGAVLERDRPPAESELKETLGKIHDVLARASAIADEWNKT